MTSNTENYNFIYPRGSYSKGYIYVAAEANYKGVS